jgi:hypothetical protein
MRPPSRAGLSKLEVCRDHSDGFADREDVTNPYWLWLSGILEAMALAAGKAPDGLR